MAKQILPNQPGIEVPVLEEGARLFDKFNDTSFDYPRGKSLADLFYEQTEKTPDNVALIYEDKEYTYAGLNAISNQFADYLDQIYTIRPDDLVAVMLDRGEWMIIAILGIIKAGGAYVPIDPANPADRVNYIKEDSACKVLIDDAELERFKLSVGRYSTQNIKNDLRSSNLAYCIYTSGSTGRPKGVLAEHRNVVNLLWYQKQVYQMTPDERVLQFTTITFDPSAEQIFIAFLTGAALVVINKSTLLDIKALEKYIIAKKVTHIHAVPAYLAELSIADMSCVKRVITGGESCLPALASKWSSHCTFINEYGPTETTITSTEYVLEKSENPYSFIPIGRPVANTRIHILNEDMKLTPFGEIGEIYIGGDGVTRGYLNRPELTAERFIGNPHQPGDRIYRTGDIGRWLPDGNIEYLGRIDDQVKIRGFRIELDEIAAVLEEHPKVSSAVVAARVISGDTKELVAYTIGTADASELNAHLRSRLPAYMVPGYYIEMESWPVSSAGKVDKKALPMPAERYNERADFAGPGSELEKQLAVVWQKKLNLEQIGIDDNFFDLGGDSLAAIGTVGQINRELDVNLNLTILYQLPTVRQLANKIETNDIFDMDPIILLKEGTGTPLFIFPQWGSYPTVFNEFVKSYQGNTPLYGVIYTEDHEHFPYKNLQEYAKFITGHIKRRYPRGPFSLLGYSIGGRIIFEVAVQLQRDGNELDMVAVISDSPPLPLKRLFLTREVRDAVMVFTKIKPGLKLKYLRRRLPRLIERVVKGREETPPVQLEIETQNRILELYLAYETKERYRGELLLIHEPSPARGKPYEFQQPEVYRYSILPRLWTKYIDGNVVEKIMDVDHSDFLKQPAVTEVADIVYNYLHGNK